MLLDIFTWWHGPGLGTRWLTRRHGSEVGRDGEGNIYYRRGAGRTERRWVIYNGGTPDASRIPPEWYLWMHKTVALPPTEAPVLPRVWERPWTPNATGTDAAYLPAGSLGATRKRPRATGDYRAWSPDGELPAPVTEG